ncbi:hypothetical protein ACS5PK_21850 [Roseateles sp. DB2]|uniref:hypothetical protein n=1 Tax=Roseateles sp. DB2 TaxID=3453717 RepID=UPI003EEB5BFA
MLGVLLPFAVRTGDFLLEVLRQGQWPAGSPFSERYYLDALLDTAWMSGMSTALGLSLGTLAAIALRHQKGWRRLMNLMGSLGANFAGVPLASALILLLGSQGWLPGLLRPMGLEPPLDLYGRSGLMLAYLLFQLPLAMMMVTAPVAQLDMHIEEAAWTLGAGPVRFWWRVGLPVLAPSLIEAASLLFANAAAAYATPFALSGTSANVLAVRIAAAVSGDIFEDPNLPQQLSLMLLLLLLGVLGLGRWASRAARRGLDGGRQQ